MRLLALILSLCAPLVACAESASPSCDSTAIPEIVACNESRYRIADAKLNSSYRAITAILTATQKKRLLNVQRTWVHFKEKHCSRVYKDMLPGQEALAEKNICLWRHTDSRWRELARLGKSSLNDDFYNFVLSLQSLGYSRNDLLARLRARYVDERDGWQEYVRGNCEISRDLNNESIELCVARLNAGRGSD